MTLDELGVQEHRAATSALESLNVAVGESDDAVELLHERSRGIPRALNNLATYCEPSYQFAMGAGGFPGGSISGGIADAPMTWWIATGTIPTISGTAFLAQMPIIIPHQATRLCWTAGIERGLGPGSIEANVNVDVGLVQLWLSPTPLRRLLTGQTATYPANSSELVGNMDASCMPSKYASRTLSVGFTGNGTGGTVYDLADDTAVGWRDFASDPSVYGSSVALTGAPIGWLILSVNYSTAHANDFIRVRDFSIWGQYE